MKIIDRLNKCRGGERADPTEDADPGRANADSLQSCSRGTLKSARRAAASAEETS